MRLAIRYGGIWRVLNKKKRDTSSRFCYNPSRLTRYVPTARFSSFAAALISSNAFFGMLQYSIASPTFFRPAFWRLPPHVLFSILHYSKLSSRTP